MSSFKSCRSSWLFVIICVLALSTSKAQVTSSFSVDAELWTVFDTQTGGSSAAQWNNSGGNPGGYIFYTTAAGYSGLYFTAPAKFLGNFSRSYNQKLTFDLNVSTLGSDNTNGDVELSGAGLTLFYQLPAKPPVGAWTNYQVLLNESQWHVGSTGGAVPSQSQMKQVLASITALQIRLKYLTGNTLPYTGQLDNVILNVGSLPIAPTITSFTPSSGVAGSTVTVTGSNFNTTASQNLVLFNGIKGAVVSATSTQLTVTSPARTTYGPISVTNLADGAQATSSLNFNPLFDNNQDFGARVIASTFAKKVDFGAATAASMSVGDLDGDGWTDVVTSSNNAGSFGVSVYRNLSQTGTVNASSFGSPITLPIPNSATAGLAQRVGRTFIEDMDGDGKTDIVVNVGYTCCGGNWDNSFVIYLNQSTSGSLSFSSGSVFQFASVNNNNEAIAVADMDGDGRPELMGAINNSACQLGIAQNLSTPGNLDFAAFQNLALGQTFGNDISVGDLTGDGKPEIILEAYLGGAIYAYENTSTAGVISLNTPFLISTFSTINIKVADMDNDGKNDLIFKDGANPSYIHLKKNNHVTGALSAGDFSADILISSIYPTGGSPSQNVGVADVNGDNKVDIIGNDGSKVVVYQNNYSGGAISASSFVPGIAFEGDGNSSNWFVFCADVDGDNKPEILIQPQSNINFRVYRNETFPAPRIDILTPTSGPWATNVSLTGDHFSTGIGVPPNFGRLGMTSTPILPASNTSASTVVPPGAISDRLSMTEHGLTGYSKPFSVLFSTTRVINSTSFTGTDFTLSSNGGLGLAVADFDNDGKPDVVVDDNNTARIFQNTQATAGAAITTASFTKLGTTLASSIRLTSGDFDGDGKIDLVTSGNLLYQNNSTTFPSFAASVASNMAGPNMIMANHDFNLDGKPELVSVNGGSLVYVFENLTRNGSFTPAPFPSFSGNGSINSLQITLSGNAARGTAADFDGDGFDDLAVGVTSTTSTLTVYPNSGLKLPITSTQFASPLTFTSNTTPTQIVAADFDGDGKLDAVLGYNIGTVLSIFKNQSTVGSISFTAKQDITVLAGITAMAAQDLDGDGLPEIITTNFTGGAGSFSVFQNTSSGTISFASPITFALASGRNPSDLAIADINFDKLPDLIVRGTGTTTNFLTVFQNNLTIVTLSVTSQPVSTAACNGATSTISSTATGTSNITYQWQFSADGILPYADITNTGGYSGVSTSTLSVNTSGLFGGGYYRCKINGDFASTVFSSAVTLTVNAIPSTSVIVGTAPVCANASAVTYSVTNTTGSSYAWVITGGIQTSGANTNSITVNWGTAGSGNVSVTETNSSSCIGTAENLPVTVNSIPAAPSVAGASNCGPGNITLTASGTTNGNYLWYDVNGLIPGQSNGTYTTPTISTTTQYSVAITNSSCTSAQTNVTATINAVPSAPTTTGAANCGSGSVTLTASGGSNGSYLWYDASSAVITGQTNGTYTTPIISTTTQYFVAITNGSCTSAQTNATATINAVPSAPTTSGATNCGSGSVTLTASGGSNGNYLWYDATSTVITGQTNSTYTTPVISSTTTYLVAITNGFCTGAITTVTATIVTVPSPPSTQGATECTGSTFLLSASGGTNGQYVWYTTPSGGSAIAGEVNSTYTTPALTVNTTYYVSITMGTCESARSAVTATVNTSGCSIPVITPTTISLQVGGLVTLNLVPLITTANNNLDVSSIVVTKQPSSGAIASVASGVLTINYKGIPFSGSEQLTIQACDTDGNCATQIFNINVAGDIIVYNGISPNGKNPAFIIEYINLLPETKDNTVYIFDRWENQVWHGTNYDNSSVVFTGISDGGSELPSGVYYYKIEFASGLKAKSGFISLRR